MPDETGPVAAAAAAAATATATAPAAPSRPNVPVYSVDDLNVRIAEGSVDVNRLAATVAGLKGSVDALVEWANAQIQAKTQTQVPESGPAAGATTQAEPDAGKRKR